MFEVGFTEILLILGLALLVLGPEKLPGLAQKIGRWTGRARAMARQLHAQLEQEVNFEEMMKARPMQPGTPPPAEPAATEPSTVDPTGHETVDETAAAPTDATPPAAPEPELDLDSLVSGIEAPSEAMRASSTAAPKPH